MKAIKPITILLITCFETLSVFSQTSTVLSYLPEDAKMIIKINPASMGKKLPWEELVNSKMFEELIKDASEDKKNFLKNPRQTGIDLEQGIFVLVPTSNKNKKMDPVIYGVPKDTAQFASMVKKLMPAKQALKINNGKLVVDKNTAIAWNKEVFIIYGNDTKESYLTQTSKSKTAAELTKTKQLTERSKTLFTKRQTAFNNEHFASLLKEDGDMFLWINNNIPTAPPQQKKGKTPKVFDMLGKNIMGSGNYTSAVIRFQNGKVTGQMKRYLSASLDSVYRKYPAKNLNAELVRKMPAGQPIFLYSFNFSPAMINEMFIKAGADKYIDSISKKKIKMGDIVSAIKGDATLAVMKVFEFTEEDSVTQALNGLQLFLAGSINDREKFKHLSAVLQSEAKDTVNKRRAKMEPIIVSSDSIFVASISPIAAQKFLESSASNDEMEKLISPYKDYPGAFILDLKTIFGIAIGMSKNKSEEEARQMSQALGMFDKLVSYGGRYDGSSVSHTIELTLTDKEENSLKQFINLINVFYLFGTKSPKMNN